MATKIGDLFFEVTSDVGPAIGSIDLLAETAGKVGNLISSVLSSAFDAVSYAARSAIAYVVEDVIQMGAQFNIAGQKGVGLFTALTGSAEDALDLMREFSQLGLDQPLFDPASLQKTASLLLTFGIAKDDVLDLSKNVNLASIALGKGQGGAIQLARALGQVNSAGRLLGGEARQLSEVGINAYALMAKELGVTTEEVKRLGRENKLLATDVLPVVEEYIEKTFGPVAQNMIGTFGVQAQGLKTIMTDVGSALVQPFIGFAGGGALTDFLSNVREELLGLVEVADDGSIRLTGALAPLTEFTQALADGFTEIGDAFLGWLHSATEGEALTDFFGGLTDMIPGLVDTILTLASGTIDFLGGLYDALEPIISAGWDRLGSDFQLILDVLPPIGDAIISIAEIAAPFVTALIEVGTILREVFGPVIVFALETIAEALELVADNVVLLEVYVGMMAATWLIANVSLVTFTATLKLATLGMGAFLVTAGLLLLALGALKGASAAISGDVGWLNEDVSIIEKPFQALGRGAFALFGGDRSLTEYADGVNAATEAGEDFNVKQLEGLKTWDEVRDAALEHAAALGYNEEQALHFANVVGLAWDKERDAAAAAKAEVDAAARAVRDAARPYEEFYQGLTQAADGMMRIQLGGSSMATMSWIDVPKIEDAADLIKMLETAAKAAATEVDNLLAPPADATIDDFLRSLPDLLKNLTDAMADSDGGILGELKIGGIEDDITAQATKVINTLVDTYGMSLEEIEAMLGDGGLNSLLEELTNTTGELVRAVDPAVAVFMHLGYSADVVAEALDHLNSQRQDQLKGEIASVTAELDAAKDAADDARDAIDKEIKSVTNELKAARDAAEDQKNAIKSQIDAVTSSLKAAKAAAEEAKEALENYFKGDTGGIQSAIDSLVLDIPDIGSDIEEALRKGGPQGEAGVRQALGSVGDSLGAIFQLGLEQGLDPSEIIRMLGPVYGSIQQELGGAMNRISSLDWEEGFTPAAAQQIKDWLAGILDPAQIEDLFAGVTGTNSMVTGLQAQLDSLNLALDAVVVVNEDALQAELDQLNLEKEMIVVVNEDALNAELDALNAELDVEVFFSSEQVQAAIDEMYPPELQTKPIVSDEAAQVLTDAMQAIFDNNDLEVAINNQNITQQIVDAAQEAANSIQLEFNSSLVFDEEILGIMADTLGGSFADLFKEKMSEALAEDPPKGNDWWRPGESATTPGGTNVVVNNDIKIDGAGRAAPAIASEMVAGSSAAAGSGGRWQVSPWARIYGPQPQ